MALPTAGSTLNNVYIYKITPSSQLGATGAAVVSAAGLTGTADLVTPVASDTTATFGTDANGPTITYGGHTSDISAVGATQDPTQFTYVSGGNTYMLSNQPLTGAANVDLTTIPILGQTLANTLGVNDVDVLSNSNLTSQQNQYDASAACYLAGTHIRTPEGDVPIEALRIGDRVLTAGGRARAIKWIGERAYAGRFLAGRSHLLPIRIRAGALAIGVPLRDLFVSPKHAMLLDGVLIPAELLINGVSVTRADRLESAHYLHVELDSHDTLLAEGAASESFVDDDSRDLFQNAASYRDRYPDEERRPAVYCAARVSDGYVLQAVRDRLALRAGIAPAPASAAALNGNIDFAGADRVAGWAQDPAHTEAPVCLDIFAGDRLVARTLASKYRPDLEQAGLGSGRHSFDVRLPAGVTGVIRVRRASDAAELPGSPACAA